MGSKFVNPALRVIAIKKLTVYHVGHRGRHGSQLSIEFRGASLTLAARYGDAFPYIVRHYNVFAFRDLANAGTSIGVRASLVTSSLSQRYLKVRTDSDQKESGISQQDPKLTHKL